MKKNQLVHIDEEKFLTKVIPANSTLEKFCIRYEIDRQGVLLELGDVKDPESTLYVILMDTVTGVHSL